MLKNNSDILEWWLRPPIDPIVKVYVFNYTNIDSFLNGSDTKIFVDEIGPYSYREHIEKVNVRFNDDQITFHVSIISDGDFTAFYCYIFLAGESIAYVRYESIWREFNRR